MGAFYNRKSHLSTPCTKNFFAFGQIDKVTGVEYNTNNEQGRSQGLVYPYGGRLSLCLSIINQVFSYFSVEMQEFV